MSKTIRTLLTFLLALLPAMAVQGAQTILFNNVPIAGTTTMLCACQDARGMLWLGTDCGLYAYDGYRTFACFTPNSPENIRVHALQPVGDRLYLGTDRGLLIYDRQTSSWLPAPEGSPTDVRALALVGTTLYAGGAKGVMAYDLNAGKFLPGSLAATPNVYSLLPFGQGRLLAGTIEGLFEIAGAKARRIALPAQRQPLVNAMLAADPEHPEKGCWIGTEGALYRYQGGSFTALPAVSGNSIKALDRDASALYVGTDNGLFVLLADGSVQHLRHDSRRDGTIADNIVWAVRSFPSGLLFAGTGGGMSLRRSSGAFTLLSMSELTGSGDGNRIYALLHAADGTTWMGGTNGLIRTSRRLDRETTSTALTAWYRLGDQLHPLPHNRVRHISADSDGDILVCTDHGVNVYEHSSGRFRNFIVSSAGGQYTSTWAYDALDDGQGRYWISAYMGGIFIIDKQALLASDGHATAQRHVLRDLQSVHVNRLLDDGHGTVYATSFEGGVDAINKQTLAVRPVLRKTPDAVATDGQGRLFVAHDGLIETFSEGGVKTSTTYELAPGSTTRVSDMTFHDGSLWVLIGNTVSRFKADGSSLRFVLCGQQPLSLSSDHASGLVFLGCDDAVAVVRPDLLNTMSRARRLALTGIEVNGTAWQGPMPASDAPQRLSFRHDENNLRLLLSDFTDHALLQPVYAYRLEGIDRTWQYISDGDLSVSYNALPHGDYTLRICVADGYGRPAETVLEVEVCVRPPWYLTLWAKAVYLLLALLALVWGVRSYIGRERRRKERLEHQQILEQSRARVAFYANLSAQLKRPIGRMLGVVYALLPEEKNPVRHQRLNEARRDVSLINELVRQSLDFEGRTQATAGDGKEGVGIDLVDFFRRTLDDEQSRPDCAHADLRFRTDTPMARTTIDMTTLQPLAVSFFHTVAQALQPKQTATCTLTSGDDGHTLVLTLHAESVVISPEQLPYVFYRYGLPASEASDKPAEGINPLSLLSDFVRSRGGDVKAESSAEQGTTITLTFPHCELAAKTKVKEPADARPLPQQPTADNADYRLLAKITQAVEEHLADTDLNVSRLQELVGIGDKLLYRRVKQMTGRTPVDFIRHIRMQRASLLLREGRFSVSEVMYMVGFSNSSYFSKCFQKVYGITPAEYMRKAPGLE